MLRLLLLNLALGIAVILLIVAVLRLGRRLEQLDGKITALAHAHDASQAAHGGPIARLRSGREYEARSQVREWREPARRSAADVAPSTAPDREHPLHDQIVPADAPAAAPSAASGDGGGEPASSTPSEPEEQREELSFSGALARELYTTWCRNGVRAQSAQNVEIGVLKYVRAARPEDFGAPERHVLAESSMPGEFIRFSAPAATEGVVYPNPDAHFSPVVNYLFAGLSRAEYGNPESLLSVEPVRVRRIAYNEWETV